MKRSREARLRLEKISEASSPSPKREDNLDELKKNRLLAFSSTSISLKKQAPSDHEHKQQELLRIRQVNEEHKQRISAWEESFLKRQGQQEEPKHLVRGLVRGLAHLTKTEYEHRYSLLRAVQGGRRGILLWLLNWLRQLFGLIRTLLVQRQSYP